MTQQNNVKPSAESLASAARAHGADRALPPVLEWNPPYCGPLDIRIACDGTWFYLGSPIGREALVRLFASILRRDGEEYFLVTPVEKVGITVDDVPFVAVDFTATGEGRTQLLTFTTNLGDTTQAGPNAPLRIETDPRTRRPRPYVRVRHALDALIDRKSFFRLAELGCVEPHEGEDWFGVWSGGTFFPMIQANELPET